MVPPGNDVGVLQQRFLRKIFQLVQHLGPAGGVLLDDLKLLRRQPSGLVQNFLVNGNFADVVQRRRQRNVVHFRGRELVAAGLFHHPLQDQLRQGADVLDVQSALAVAKLHDLAQHAHQHGGVVFLLAHLLGDHFHEAALFCVEVDGVVHPAVDHLAIKGAVDVIGGTPLVGLADGVVRVVGGNHDDGHVLNGVVPCHVVQHLKPAHDGHIHVQQHHGYVACVLLQLLQALFAVGGFQHPVIPAQNLGEHGPVHLGVVDDEHLRLALRRQYHVAQQGRLARPVEHHGVFLVFGLRHHLVGAAHRHLNGVGDGLHHAANADGEVQMRVPRHRRFGHLGANLFQLLLQ